MTDKEVQTFNQKFINSNANITPFEYFSEIHKSLFQDINFMKLFVSLCGEKDRYYNWR